MWLNMHLLIKVFINLEEKISDASIVWWNDNKNFVIYIRDGHIDPLFDICAKMKDS